MCAQVPSNHPIFWHRTTHLFQTRFRIKLRAATTAFDTTRSPFSSVRTFCGGVPLLESESESREVITNPVNYLCFRVAEEDEAEEQNTHNLPWLRIQAVQKCMKHRSAVSRLWGRLFCVDSRTPRVLKCCRRCGMGRKFPALKKLVTCRHAFVIPWVMQVAVDYRFIYLVVM